MLACVRKLFIVGALASWGMLVLCGVAVYQGLSTGFHTAPLRAAIVWALPATLLLHGVAALLVINSEWAYARAWALGLVASGLGQLGVFLVLLSVADKLADWGFPVF